MRRVLCLLVAGWSQTALGQSKPPSHETATLHYERHDAAESCPDASNIADRVAAQLGYQPFAEEGRLKAEVILSGDAHGLKAHLTLTDANGKSGHRELTSPSHDCEELAASVSLALSIAIDPVSAGKEHPTSEPPAEKPEPPAPVEPPPRVEPAPKRPAPSVPETPATPVALRLGAGAHESFGTAPAPAFGVFVFAGAERGALSLDLEASADLPASRGVEPRGEVESSLLLLTLLPCFHARPWFACASFAGGALQGSGKDVAEPAKQTTFYSAGGARLGAELALSDKTAISLFGAGAATLTRTTLHLNGNVAWTTPTLTGMVGAGFVLRLE